MGQKQKGGGGLGGGGDRAFYRETKDVAILTKFDISR